MPPNGFIGLCDDGYHMITTIDERAKGGDGENGSTHEDDTCLCVLHSPE
jgi:hypothetical protein